MTGDATADLVDVRRDRLRARQDGLIGAGVRRLQPNLAEVHTMLRTRTIALAFTAATALGGMIGCPSRDAEVQEAPAPIGRQDAPPHRGPPGEMTGQGPGAMAGQCMQQMHERMTSIDKVTSTIDEAKQSQDRTQIAAALDLARAELQNVKQHHTMCMEMMHSRGRVPPAG